jgi:integrase
VRGATRHDPPSRQLAAGDRLRGVDPLTGRRLYLRESTTDEDEAQRILTRLSARVDEQRHAKNHATFRVAVETWLHTYEVEGSTRASYEQYARSHIYPAFGDEPIGKVSTRLLEEFYAELRRCRVRCDGRPFIEHRTSEPHDCREVKHRWPPGRPPVVGYPPHDCVEQGCKVVECQPHVCRPLSAATIRRSTSPSAACSRQLSAGSGSSATLQP